MRSCSTMKPWVFGLLLMLIWGTGIGIAGCAPQSLYNHDAMEWQSRALHFQETQEKTAYRSDLIVEDNVQLRKENQKLRDVVVILAEKLEMILKAQAQR